MLLVVCGDSPNLLSFLLLTLLLMAARHTCGGNDIHDVTPTC